MKIQKNETNNVDVEPYTISASKAGRVSDDDHIELNSNNSF